MDYKLTFEDGSDGYLKHFGVKGMHWGVWNEETRQRRLGLHTQKKSNDRTVLQRLGIVKDPQRNKERYRRMSGEGTTYTKDGLNLEKGSETNGLENHQALGYLDKSEATTKEFQRLSASAKKLDDEYNEHWDLAEKAVKKVVNDPETIKEARSLMKKELNRYDMVDDKDLIDLVASDVAWELMHKRARQTTEGKKVSNYETRLNGWFDDAKSTTNRLVESVGNKPIKTRYGNTDYEKVVTNTLLEAQGSSGFLSYAARHGVMDEVIGNVADFDTLEKKIIEDFTKAKS